MTCPGTMFATKARRSFGKVGRRRWLGSSECGPPGPTHSDVTFQTFFQQEARDTVHGLPCYVRSECHLQKDRSQEAPVGGGAIDMSLVLWQAWGRRGAGGGPGPLRSSSLFRLPLRAVDTTAWGTEVWASHTGSGEEADRTLDHRSACPPCPRVGPFVGSPFGVSVRREWIFEP